MDSTRHSCSEECPGWRYDPKAIAYERADGNCPTDELLLARWSRKSCQVCLWWWVERVYCDPRYLALCKRMAAKWPGADIEVCVSDVLISIRNRASELPDIQKVAAYLQAAVQNLADRDVGRSRKCTIKYVDLKLVADNRPRAAMADDWRVTEQRLEEALAACEAALSDAVSPVIRLRYTEGYSTTQITSALGITAAVCYKRLDRGRHALLDCVKNRLDID